MDKQTEETVFLQKLWNILNQFSVTQMLMGAFILVNDLGKLLRYPYDRILHGACLVSIFTAAAVMGRIQDDLKCQLKKAPVIHPMQSYLEYGNKVPGRVWISLPILVLSVILSLIPDLPFLIHTPAHIAGITLITGILFWNSHPYKIARWYIHCSELQET